MKRFDKQYQLWTKSDYSYSPTEFDTLEELLNDLAMGYSSDFYITQKVDLKDIPINP